MGCLTEKKTPVPPNVASLETISVLHIGYLSVLLNQIPGDCQFISPAFLDYFLVEARDAVFAPALCVSNGSGCCLRALLAALSGFSGERLRGGLRCKCTIYRDPDVTAGHA